MNVAHQNSSPDLSLVVLCYKAGAGVQTFAARTAAVLSGLTENWEMVLVGNYNAGEADDTPRHVIESAATDKRIKAVCLEKRGWMGWDARSGLAVATGSVIALIDGDNQMPPEDIATLYHKMTAEGLDVAMPYRVQRKDGVVRLLNSRIYNAVYNLMFPGYHVIDVNAKPKLLSKAFYDKLTLTADDWFLDAEILIQARRNRAKLGQIPTVFHKCDDRRSFVRPNAVLEFLLNLVRARIREFFIKP